MEATKSPNVNDSKRSRNTNRNSHPPRRVVESTNKSSSKMSEETETVNGVTGNMRVNSKERRRNREESDCTGDSDDGSVESSAMSNEQETKSKRYDTHKTDVRQRSQRGLNKSKPNQENQKTSNSSRNSPKYKGDAVINSKVNDARNGRLDNSVELKNKNKMLNIKPERRKHGVELEGKNLSVSYSDKEMSEAVSTAENDGNDSDSNRIKLTANRHKLSKKTVVKKETKECVLQMKKVHSSEEISDSSVKDCQSEVFERSRKRSRYISKQSTSPIQRRRKEEQIVKSPKNADNDTVRMADRTTQHKSTAIRRNTSDADESISESENNDEGNMTPSNTINERREIGGKYATTQSKDKKRQIPPLNALNPSKKVRKQNESHDENADDQKELRTSSVAVLKTTTTKESNSRRNTVEDKQSSKKKNRRSDDNVQIEKPPLTPQKQPRDAFHKKHPSSKSKPSTEVVKHKWNATVGDIVWAQPQGSASAVGICINIPRINHIHYTVAFIAHHTHSFVTVDELKQFDPIAARDHSCMRTPRIVKSRRKVIHPRNDKVRRQRREAIVDALGYLDKQHCFENSHNFALCNFCDKEAAFSFWSVMSLTREPKHKRDEIARLRSSRGSGRSTKRSSSGEASVDSKSGSVNSASAGDTDNATPVVKEKGKRDGFIGKGKGTGKNQPSDGLTDDSMGNVIKPTDKNPSGRSEKSTHQVDRKIRSKEGVVVATKHNNTNRHSGISENGHRQGYTGEGNTSHNSTKSEKALKSIESHQTDEKTGAAYDDAIPVDDYGDDIDMSEEDIGSDGDINDRCTNEGKAVNEPMSHSSIDNVNPKHVERDEDDTEERSAFSDVSNIQSIDSEDEENSDRRVEDCPSVGELNDNVIRNVIETKEVLRSSDMSDSSDYNERHPVATPSTLRRRKGRGKDSTVLNSHHKEGTRKSDTSAPFATKNDFEIGKLEVGSGAKRNATDASHVEGEKECIRDVKRDMKKDEKLVFQSSKIQDRTAEESVSEFSSEERELIPKTNRRVEQEELEEADNMPIAKSLSANRHDVADKYKEREPPVVAVPDADVAELNGHLQHTPDEVAIDDMNCCELNVAKGSADINTKVKNIVSLNAEEKAFSNNSID